MLTVDDILAMNPATRGLLLGASLKHLSREDAQRLKASDAFSGMNRGAKMQLTMLVNGTKTGRHAGAAPVVHKATRTPRFGKWIATASVDDIAQVLAAAPSAVTAKLEQAMLYSADLRRKRDAKQQQIDELKAELKRLEEG